jgi:hypothetical protein
MGMTYAGTISSPPVVLVEPGSGDNGTAANLLVTGCCEASERDKRPASEY